MNYTENKPMGKVETLQDQERDFGGNIIIIYKRSCTRFFKHYTRPISVTCTSYFLYIKVRT